MSAAIGRPTPPEVPWPPPPSPPLRGGAQVHGRRPLRPAEMQPLADLTGRLKEPDIRRVAIDTSNLLRSSFSRDRQYILQPLDPTYGALHRYLDMALPDRSALAKQVPFQVQDGSGPYWLPHGLRTPASLMTSLR